MLILDNLGYRQYLVHLNKKLERGELNILTDGTAPSTVQKTARYELAFHLMGGAWLTKIQRVAHDRAARGGIGPILPVLVLEYVCILHL